jgi:hypothetical protein
MFKRIFPSIFINKNYTGAIFLKQVKKKSLQFTMKNFFCKLQGLKKI